MCNMINCHKLLMSLVIEYGRRRPAARNTPDDRQRDVGVNSNICPIESTPSSLATSLRPSMGFQPNLGLARATISRPARVLPGQSVGQAKLD